jgi:hypothetical protein
MRRGRLGRPRRMASVAVSLRRPNGPLILGSRADWIVHAPLWRDAPPGRMALSPRGRDSAEAKASLPPRQAEARPSRMPLRPEKAADAGFQALCPSDGRDASRFQALRPLLRLLRPLFRLLCTFLRLFRPLLQAQRPFLQASRASFGGATGFAQADRAGDRAVRAPRALARAVRLKPCRARTRTPQTRRRRAAPGGFRSSSKQAVGEGARRSRAFPARVLSVTQSGPEGDAIVTL